MGNDQLVHRPDDAHNFNAPGAAGSGEFSKLPPQLNNDPLERKSGVSGMIPANEVRLDDIERRWDAIAGEFDRYKDDTETVGNALEIPQVIATLKDGKHIAGKNVLELGPGPRGILWEIFENGNGGSPARAVAVDISQPMLDLLERHIADAPWRDRVELVHAPIEQFQGQRQFDTVVGNYVLDNIFNIDAGLGNINSCLKMGGVFVGLVKDKRRHEAYLNGTEFPFIPGFSYMYEEWWRGTGRDENGKPRTVLSWYPDQTAWTNKLDYNGFRVNFFDPRQGLTDRFRAMHPRAYAEAMKRPSGLILYARKLEDIADIRAREAEL